MYLNKDNDIFTEKLNILLGLPIPTVNSGEAEIKYISGKYYEKYTILTKIIKELDINKDTPKLLKLFFDLLNKSDIIFNYIDKLPAPNSFKYSYIDYILKYYILNKDELEKLENDTNIKNELSNLYNNIIKKYNKNNLENISIESKLYFSNFSYELKKDENIKLYQMKIEYETLKELKKTNLDCFNNTSFFSSINNNDNVNKETKEEKNEIKEINDEIKLDNFICLLIFCHTDFDIYIEFKPYFNSKLEIKGKKNCHYIFYCTNNEAQIDYNKIKIESKEITKSDNEFNYIINFGGQNMEVKLTPGMYIYAPCEVCGVKNIITTKTTELKCSFCECPLNNVIKI